MLSPQEDAREQELRVADARTALASRLFDLADGAKKEAKAAAAKRGNPDLDHIRALARAVADAGESLDFAVYDLSTARGAHG